MTNSALRNSSVDIIFSQAMGMYLWPAEAIKGLTNGDSGRLKSLGLCLFARCTDRPEDKSQKDFLE